MEKRSARAGYFPIVERHIFVYNNTEILCEGGGSAVGYALKLKKSDVLPLPRRDVRALLQCGDGNAALLYLSLAEAQEAVEEEALCRALHWNRAALDGAVQQLEKLGLLGEKQVQQEAAAAAPEREKRDYSRADIAAYLEENSDYASLRRAVGEKLQKLMTEKDDDMLLGLYDYLGLPSDVIFLLVGHCIQRTERRYGAGRRPTMRQVEKEGYRWKRLGLMTQELAIEYLKDYAQKQSVIPRMMEALHLEQREPVSRELEFLERWIDWGFPPESVECAYEKTVFKCGKLEWKYCNGILRDWDKKGLHTPEEIAAMDRPADASAAGQKKADAAAADRVRDSVAWMKEYLKQSE